MKTIKEELQELGLSDKINKNLESSFNEALKDKKFKEFISILKMNKKDLIKYTSLLQKSSCEYNNCKNCKSIMECKNNQIGFAYLPKIKNNKINFNYKACRYKEKILKELKYLNNITLYQTPERLLENGLDKIDTKDKKRHDVIKWAINFLKEYPNINNGIYLHGSFGSGKSYIINALLVELAKKDVKSTIVFWPEFLRNLKTYFNSNGELDLIIKQIKNTPILFIDDIGAENVTAWSRDEILSTILDYRMNNRLITLFASNLSLDELEKHLSQTKDGTEIIKARRIMERVKQLTEEVQLISKNLRN